MNYVLYFLAFVSAFLVVAFFAPEYRGPRAKRPKQPFLRNMRPVFQKGIPIANRYLPMYEYRKKVAAMLIVADDPHDITVDEFVAWKLMGAVALPTILFLLGFPIFIVFGAAFLGWFYPDIWLKDIIKKRKKLMLKALPGFVDMLTLTVEAGVDFNQAIAKVIEKSKPSPLLSQFRVMLQEIKIGTTRAEALRNLSERVGIPDLSSLISALIQSEKLGVSLGPTLRIQSEQMRERRFQRAEKAANEAPVKMLMPLIGLIFPATFIILFGPIAIELMKTF